MKNQAIFSPVRRYGLVLVLLIVLGGVVYLQGYPHEVPPTPLPGLAGGVPIVADDKALYHIDAVLAQDGPHAVVDAPAPHVETAAGKSISVVGWAVDAQQSRPAAGVAAVVDGKIKIAGIYGNLRPDVAQAFNNPAYGPSAFSIVVPAGALPSGKHSFQLFILSADRSKFYQAPKAVTVEAGP